MKFQHDESCAIHPVEVRLNQRLLPSFDVDLDRDNAYYLVAPPKAFGRPNVQAFRDFLLAEVASEGDGRSDPV